CYMTDSKSYWRFISFYAPLWLAVCINAYVYIAVLRMLRKSIAAAGSSTGDATTASIRAMMRRLQMYPFILVIVWSFATIIRLYELATGGDQIFTLFLLQRA